jgi:hypothetical protein
MTKSVYVLKDSNQKVVAVYDATHKETVKLLLPHIETKLVVNIEEIEEVPLSPTIDIVGNKNWIKSMTIKEFLES